MPKLLNVDCLKIHVRTTFEESLHRSLSTAKDCISFVDVAKLKCFQNYVSLHAQYQYGFHISNGKDVMLVASSDEDVSRSFAFRIDSSAKKCEYVIDVDQTIRQFVKCSRYFRIGVNTDMQLAIFLDA